jgi:hypothetical protein
VLMHFEEGAESSGRLFFAFAAHVVLAGEGLVMDAERGSERFCGGGRRTCSRSLLRCSLVLVPVIGCCGALLGASCDSCVSG